MDLHNEEPLTGSTSAELPLSNVGLGQIPGTTFLRNPHS